MPGPLPVPGDRDQCRLTHISSLQVTEQAAQDKVRSRARPSRIRWNTSRAVIPPGMTTQTLEAQQGHADLTSCPR